MRKEYVKPYVIGNSKFSIVRKERKHERTNQTDN